MARCDWRTERNRNPTLSGLWINIQGLGACEIRAVPRHTQHVAQPRGILQSRQRRLGTQITAAVRQPTAGQFECGVASQMIEVVGILVTAADREHPRAKHVGKAVDDARRIAPIR